MRRRPPIHATANLTPLIDVTFLLIVFFILAAQIHSQQYAAEVELPQPDRSIARDPGEERRVTLNLIPTSDGAELTRLRLGTLEFAANAEGLDALTRELRSALPPDTVVVVDVRADRRTPCKRIFPVLQAVRAAGVTRLNLMVLPEDHPSP